MLKIAVLLIFFSISQRLQAALPVDESWVRLRLHENVKSLSIQGYRIEIQDSPRKKNYQNVSAAPALWQSLNVQFETKWKQSFLQVMKINHPMAMKSGSVFISGETMTIKGQPVANFIQLLKRQSGFDVIAYVKLRDYLRGVVSAEMPSHWPAETLKAQIVAARSYALYMVEQRKGSVFDLEASIKDQAYQHTASAALEPLLVETKNLVLFDQKKRLFKAYYHSECGGRTSSAKKVFGDSRFDAEVNDPYCTGRRWRLKISKQELENIVGPFKEIISAFNPLQRSDTIDLRGIDNGVFSVDAQKLRMSLGSTRMKSTWIEMKRVGNEIEFYGKGYGHGVGLCQWGSRQMGLMKKNFRDILDFYYPKSLLRTAVSDTLHL